MCNCKIRTWSLAFRQFRIHKVISDKNSTLIDSTLVSKCAKFGAKIFRHYFNLHMLGVGSFFKPHLVGYSPPATVAVSARCESHGNLELWHHISVVSCCLRQQRDTVCTFAIVTCQTDRFFRTGTCTLLNASHKISFSWLWRCCSGARRKTYPIANTDATFSNV